jgi:uncharacterized protein (DUF305 family)
MRHGMAGCPRGAKLARLIFVALTAGAISLVASGCGGDGGASANGTDKAFASEMISHHEGTIEIGRLAEARAGRPRLRLLARRIVTSRRAEIEVLRFIKSELQKSDVPPGELGLSEEQMAQQGDEHRLRDADDFDRAFLEIMIALHGGAINIAAVELRNGRDSRSKELARSIIDTQEREIRQMEGWFADWYGGEPDLEGSGEQGS